MSDTNQPPVPNLPPEELASAYLDGELSAEARRRVEGDLSLMAIVRAHTTARDAVAAPVEELTTSQREEMVAAALAELVQEAEPAAPAGSVASVVPLATARQARSRRTLRIVAGGLAAAAAAGLLALVLTRASSSDSGRTGTDAATAEQAADSTAGGARSADTIANGAAAATQPPALEAAASAAATEPPGTPAPGPEAPTAGNGAGVADFGLADLGPLADRTAFIAAARPFATTSPPDGPIVCTGYPAPLATATFKGIPAYLVLVQPSPAGNRLALVEAGTCTVLVKVDLAEQ